MSSSRGSVANDIAASEWQPACLARRPQKRRKENIYANIGETSHGTHGPNSQSHDLTLMHYILKPIFG